MSLLKKPAPPPPVRDSRVIARELQRLCNEGVALTPRNVVSVARNADHPLHRYFEWNNTVAGARWREHQALKMIMALHTFKVVTGSTRNVVADGAAFKLRSVLPKRDGSTEFIPRNQALADPENRERLVRAFLAELQSWIWKTADISELEPIRKAVTKALSPGILGTAG